MYSRSEERAIEGDPLVYIVAVLLFYSAGMAALLINYMKKVIRHFVIWRRVWKVGREISTCRDMTSAKKGISKVAREQTFSLCMTSGTGSYKITQ